MSSEAFSQYVMSIDDLYNMGIRNGFYLPKQSCSAVNELMLSNVLKGQYWCPKTEEIRMKSIVKGPLKEVLLVKLCQICYAHRLNVGWIDDTHVPDKLWLVNVLATIDPTNEIFDKDYVAPPIKMRLRDIETIVLPTELFEGLPKSTSKNKVRRLKVISEALATEKSTRLRDIRDNLDHEIVEQEERRDRYQLMQQPREMMPAMPPRIRMQEERKVP
jgi:hypothetical protein